MDDAVEVGIDLVRKRTDVMRALRGERLDPRAVEERTGGSRSTVNRALRALEEGGLAARESGKYTLTPVGRLALDHHLAYREGWHDLLAAEDVLSGLPSTADLPMTAVSGAEPVVAPSETPYRPVQALLRAVEDADRYRAALPALDDPKEIRLLYEHVVTDGNPAELVVPPALRASLVEEYPRRLAAMAETGDFELLVGGVPEFGLVLTAGDGGATVTVVVYGEEGGIVGLLVNETDAAVRWGRERYASIREGAEGVTEKYDPTADGGVATDGDPIRPGGGLPVALDREGFVRVDRSFLLDREAADPATAWRAGLDVAEVHTGYAIEREADGETLSERLIGALDDGEDCVLVGPPGSGKSTTAKRVACEWYDADRGPVFYRAGDRGTAVESVDRLVATAVAAEGHALVVVEDAVRPDAAAVFEALERAGDREDVSFLLDAREREWRDPPADVPVDGGNLRVETMPGLDDDGYRRLVAQFEATADTTIDASVERLRSEVADSLPAGEGAAGPSEVLLATHRLSTYADPLSAGPTGLEADAAAVYDAAAGTGEVAIDVAVTANLLNAAGVAFGPAHLHAVADAREEGGRPDAALDVLDGRVTFGLDGETYRTIHEAWSTAFLAEVLDREGEAAASERAGRCLSAILALADDPSARERAAGTAGLPSAFEEIEVAPSEWADGVVETVLEAGQDRPKIAPLLGDAAGLSFEAPDACESVTPEDRTLALGEAFFRRGDFDRAMAAFERLPETGRWGAERALGRCRVAFERGEFETAWDCAERARALARDVGDEALLARSEHRLGMTAEKRGEFEVAVDHIERALATFEESNDRRELARLHRALGRNCYYRSDYEGAVTNYRRSIDIAREIGDRQTEAESYTNLGAVFARTNEYDRAREMFERGLEIARDLGNRKLVAAAINNLGVMEESRLGNHERAREYLERGLELNRELGRTASVAGTLSNLGMAAEGLGDLDAARTYLAESLELHREMGDVYTQVINLANIGDVARQQGDYEQAREYLQEGLELSQDISELEQQAAILREFGKLARDVGEYDRATDYLERARSTFEELDNEREIGYVLRILGDVARERGAYDEARERLTTALTRAEDAAPPEEVLDVVESLVELERAAGDDGTAREWCEEAIERAGSAEDPLTERRKEFEALLAGLGDGS